MRPYRRQYGMSMLSAALIAVSANVQAVPFDAPKKALTKNQRKAARRKEKK